MSYKYRNVEASEYSEGVSENVDRKQLTAMVYNGKDPSPCPVLGLDYHPRWVGYYVHNKEEIITLNKIVEALISRGLNGAIKFCKEHGYVTKVWWTKEKNKGGVRVPPKKMGGKPFNNHTMIQLLTNPKIRGQGFFVDAWDMFPQQRDKNNIVRWDYWHKKEFGSIISEDDIEQIDNILEGRSKRKLRDNNFILSGILTAPDGSRYNGCPNLVVCAPLPE